MQQRQAAARGHDIAPFYVMEVMRAAEQREQAGHGVLHLEVGQPATPAPAPVIAAAHRALDSQVLGYTTASGVPELRQRVADHYRHWYQVTVDPDSVMLTVGASGAFVAAFLAAFDPGDRVVVPSPGYPCYRNALVALGCEVVDLPTTSAERFQPTVEQLESLVATSGPVKGLVLSSPSNPTGTMLEEQRLAQLAGWCQTHGAWFVSDEIYHGLTYGNAAATALQFDPEAIVINSFSKYFSMTGWRLGWIVMPDRLREPLLRVGQNLTIAAPTLSQLAAVAAFDSYDECEANRKRYERNRAVVLDGLQAAGLTDIAPSDGAFYLWLGIGQLVDDGRVVDSQELSARWLNELGVAVTAGVDFDPVGGGRYVRISFAGSTEDCTEAMVRLKDWMAP